MAKSVRRSGKSALAPSSSPSGAAEAVSAAPSGSASQGASALALYPEYQAASFRASLRAQAAAFFDDVVRRQGGQLGALFTSSTVFYNRDLGGYYGVTGGEAFQALEKRDEGQEPLRVISYKGPNQPNTAVDDPFQIYARIFANANLSDAELQRLLADRRSVLDFLKDDIARLQGRMNAEDRGKLEAHLSGLRGIEQGLRNTALACEPPTLPSKFDTRAMERFPDVAKLQLDLMLLAQICGMTRVSTFMFANADSWQYYPWIGVNEEHHELSHAGDDDAAANEKLVKINQWHTEQFKYLLDTLAAAQEPDGSSMLDSSLVLWGNELGAGNTHTYMNIPWVVAGGAGGYLQLGRQMSYRDLPHNDLLVSVCHAMGFADVTTFGIPGVCTGPLPGLTA